MKEYIRQFWTLAVSLAGLVGLYLGAVAVNLTWAFWAVVVLAGAGATVPGIRKWLVETRAALRNQPLLKAEIASLTERITTVSQQLAQAHEAAEERYSAGLEEGAARIIGTVMSDVAPPKIIGIAERRGSMTLVARFDGPEPSGRARFTVIASGTGEVRGAVRVLEIEKSRKLVYLSCVDAVSQQFWAHLEQRMAYDSTAPKGVELVRYAHDGKRLVVDEIAATEAIESVEPEAEK